MARILGYPLPENKPLVIGLTYVYGLNKTRSKKLCEKLNFDLNLRIKDLREKDLQLISDILRKETFKVGAELRQEEKIQLKRLLDNGCFRGYRHRLKLPVRGQRTHTNSKTQRKLGGIRLKK